MNEETIIENRTKSNGQSANNKEGASWKHVTLSGASGILMGAGLMYAANASAKNDAEIAEQVDAVNVEAEEAAQANMDSQDVAVVEAVPAANVSDDISFSEAFAAARAAVGPGGVFEWHGGVYNTYTADEWNAMSDAQKDEFAQQVSTVTPASQVQTPTDAHTHVVVVHDVQPAPEATPASQDDVQAIEQQLRENFDMGDDVHIVGFANADGYLAVGYDTDNDGQADVAIIDVDGSGTPSAPDVITDGHNATTLGELNQHDPNQMAAMENPDVAPDMPDYANNMMVDA